MSSQYIHTENKRVKGIWWQDAYGRKWMGEANKQRPVIWDWAMDSKNMAVLFFLRIVGGVKREFYRVFVITLYNL